MLPTHLTPCKQRLEKVIAISKVSFNTNEKVTTIRNEGKQGICQELFNRKSISRKITHPQSLNLQAKLTGEKLKG